MDRTNYISIGVTRTANFWRASVKKSTMPTRNTNAVGNSPQEAVGQLVLQLSPTPLCIEHAYINRKCPFTREFCDMFGVTTTTLL